jgi:dihydrofolate synthase/folylpolyglutamate synthase
MVYHDLLRRLFAARRFGVDLSLERIEACLARLGHPERAPRARIHIGGTNGKGSTAAFTDAILRAAGLRVGLFTSPHLVRFAERFRVDGAPLHEAQILASANAVHGAGGGSLTFFEQVTAMALWAFAVSEVDVAILEVGLGGRLDATNAVAAEVAVVTGVSLDHQAHLGDTVAAIAAEKAGIFKPDQRVVIGCAGRPEAVPILRARAEAVGAAAIDEVGPDHIAAIPAEVGALGLAGAHQRANAACAVAAADAAIYALAWQGLDADGVGGGASPGIFRIDAGARRVGLATARIPGRFEALGHDPRIVIDGAHNPDAAAVVARAIAELPRPRVIVLGASGDKDLAGIAAPLCAVADAVVCTRYAQPRSASVEAVIAAVRAVSPPELAVFEAPDAAGALAIACVQAGADGAIVACGSLMLAGEVRALVTEEPTDPIVLTDPL